MENLFDMRAVPDDAEIILLIPTKGYFTITLRKGSPVRRLLEQQEEFEQAFNWRE